MAMFEISVASKYLLPRRRQLSVSIISLISVLVISLVVWLIVVFFSVTDGLEKSWVQKLTALTAPVRITPTNAYYNSYYYQIDSISEASDYSYKSIREKLESDSGDPYQPEYDQEIPGFWPQPDLTVDGQLKDLTQLAFASVNEIQGVKGIKAEDFELTASHIHLGLQREMAVMHPHNFYGGTVQTSLSYPSYLGNFAAENPHFEKTLLPLEINDANNYLSLIGFATDLTQEDQANEKRPLSSEILRERLAAFFDAVEVLQLRAKPYGWTIPRSLLPQQAQWEACALLKDQTILRLMIPLKLNQREELQKFFDAQNLQSVSGSLSIHEGQILWTASGDSPIAINRDIPMTLIDQAGFSAHLIPESLTTAKRLDEIQFNVEISIQNSVLKGTIPYKGLEMAAFSIQSGQKTPWIYRSESGYILPEDPQVGEGILLPKSFKDAGVFIGDRGTLSYLAPTVSLLQEQYVPVYVAGFYDPGIIPIGGKFILANQHVTGLIRASHQPDDKTALTNGINVRFDSIDQADEVKNQLLAAFEDKSISRYWNVQTYREYEFTKEIMQELQSQKYLFMLIAIVIILVACSNIISMLIILVNDKKVEIGILRAMGASSKSIALIFGLAGAAIGLLGSFIGIGLAIFTLKHLDLLVRLLSNMQGHEMFSASVYGHVLPSELSYEALFFVLMATILISLLAGIVPAVKACLVRPSAILRSSGE